MFVLISSFSKLKLLLYWKTAGSP